MSVKKNIFSFKNNKIVFEEEKEEYPENSYAVLGKYVPIHKYTKKSDTPKEKKVTSPIENTEPTFCIYDGDYIQGKNYNNSKIVKKQFGDYLKAFFVNLPFINILFLLLKKSKIKQTISTIDEMSYDIDTYSMFMKTNPLKYQAICKNLIKTSNIQKKIQKEIIDEM